MTTKDPEGFAVASELFDRGWQPELGAACTCHRSSLLGCDRPARRRRGTARRRASRDATTSRWPRSSAPKPRSLSCAASSPAVRAGRAMSWRTSRHRTSRECTCSRTWPTRASPASPSSPASVTFSRGRPRHSSEGARSRVERRLAAVAAAHLSVLERGSADSSARTAVESTLRDRLIGSATGGGLLRRETPYLAIAAGDPEWIAAERAVIEQLRRRERSTRALLHEPRRRRPRTARRRRQPRRTALARSPGRVERARFRSPLDRRARGPGDLRGAGTVRPTKRRGWPAPPSRRANDRGYRYRYPHLAELPSGSDEGRALSLEEATAYARRSRGQRVRPVSGWAALTPTEAEVARAVADGLTNKQAAERLFMSVPTVKTHLRHIFAKLEIDNRTQLVAEVAQNHTLTPTSSHIGEGHPRPPSTSSLHPVGSIPSCRPISSRRSMYPHPDQTRLGA